MVVKMKIITLAAQKGGSGKSSLATSLAVLASKSGKTILIDCDSQQSAFKWSLRRDEDAPLVVQEQPKNLEANIKGLSGMDFEYVIIDSPGKNDTGTSLAIKTADLCIIPCRPVTDDFESNITTFNVAHRLDVPTMWVPNMLLTQKSKRATDLVRGMKSLGGIMGPVMVMRYDHVDASSLGLGVTEYNNDDKAAKETKALWKKIETTLEKLNNGKA